MVWIDSRERNLYKIATVKSYEGVISGAALSAHRIIISPVGP